MPDSQLCLLGPPMLTQGSSDPVPLVRTKARALLYYLAAQPGRMFSRLQLAQLLWEENEEADGRRNLSTTLTRLHHMLPAWPAKTQGDEIGWDPAAPIQVDTTTFLDLTRTLDPRGLAPAIALWRGPFLEGFAVGDSEAYDQWLGQERVVWEQRVLTALDTAVKAMLTAARWDSALQYARKALAIDPLQERFHRPIMTALYHTGNRAGALSQFDQCRRLLHDGLGVGPESLTIGLRDAIVAGNVTPPPMASSSRPPAVRVQTQSAEAAPAPTPLAGRALELSRVQAAIADARQDLGRVVWLEGEAGSGKSRLLQAVLEGDRQQGAGRTLLSARCFETAQSLAYAALVAALTPLLPSLDVVRLPLPEPWLAEVTRLLPDLAIQHPGLPAPPSLTAAEARQRLCEGVARLIAAFPGQPLFVLDDIQWVDEDSLQLLVYVARHSLSTGLALLLTSRTGDLAANVVRALGDLDRDGLLRHIRLEPLPGAALAELVEAVTGRPDTRLADELARESGGNLRFAVELLRSPSPSALAGAVRERLDKLPANARQLITAASVCPDVIPVSLLQQLSGLAEDPLLAALDITLGTGLFRPVEQHSSGPAVTFAHPVVRRVTCSGLSDARRTALQRRTREYLLQTQGPTRAVASAPSVPVGGGLQRAAAAISRRTSGTGSDSAGSVPR
jgi:DNA-binding SARP family transcriptional activator